MDLGTEAEGIRVDTGVEQGDTISPYYDPMIAKLIVHANTRDKALDLLELRLKSARIAGPVTNTAFLGKLCADGSFRKQNFDTSLIDTRLDDLIMTKPVGPDVIAKGLQGLIARDQLRLKGNPDSPWQALDAFQLSGSREVDWDYLMDSVPDRARVQFGQSGLGIQNVAGDWVSAAHDADCFGDGTKVFVLQNGRQSVFEPFTHSLTDEGSMANADGVILVPMHGKIISVTIVDGDFVEQGDILFSVEAMKMEHAVLAPHDGVVDGLSIAADDQVENGKIALKLVVEDQEAAA